MECKWEVLTAPLCSCSSKNEIDPGCVPTPKCVVNHPQHYGGDSPYEAIKVIEAWGLGFNLGNTVKYISRAGKKNPAKEIEDLEKAAWYLQRHIDNLKKTNKC
jgi:hypothetical protein